MLGNFTNVLENNYKQFERILTPNIVKKLAKANDSNDISNLLLNEDADEPRVIDKLITHPKAKKCLIALRNSLDPDAWYNILSQKNKFGLNAVDLWMQNNCQPESVFKLMTDGLSSLHKISLLTQSVECVIKDRKLKFSMLTNPRVKLSQCLAVLKDLDDEEKYIALMALDGGNEKNLLVSSKTRDKTDKLLSIIQDKDLRAKLNDFKKKYLMKQKAAHFLGIRDKKGYPLVVQMIAYEGMDRRISFEHFVPMLNTYRPSKNYTKEFNKIKNAFIATFFVRKTNNPRPYIDRYHLNELTIIHSGTPTHTIMLAAIRKFLVVANRGEGMHPLGGCIIYELKKELTKNDFKAFFEAKQVEEITQRIKKISKSDKEGNPIIIAALPLKPQKYETCAIANKKAVVAGVLPLLRHLKQSRSKGDENKINNQLLAEARFEYKRFTKYTRHNMLTEILTELHDNPLNREMLLESLVDYCNQHSDGEDLIALELILRIITELPKDLYADFKNKLFSPSFILISYLEKYGIRDPIPDIVKKASSLALRAVKLNDRKAFNSSLLALLEEQHSEDESLKWCHDYYKFLKNEHFYDILSIQMRGLSVDQLHHMLSSDHAKKFVQLIPYLESSSGKDVLELIASLSTEQRKSLLTFKALMTIKTSTMLDIVLKDFSEKQMIALFTKSKDGVSILQQSHNFEYLEYLKNRIEYKTLKKIIKYEFEGSGDKDKTNSSLGFIAEEITPDKEEAETEPARPTIRSKRY